LLHGGRQRALFREMRHFIGRLPAALENPLPAAMEQLTPNDRQQTGLAEDMIRRLADVVALIERRSPLGLCLRRSLLRYHYLRRAGVPVAVCFGARMTAGQSKRKVAGHAWTTLDNQPYHEEDENWRNFVVMFRWPQEVSGSDPLTS
jgi:hypothetical protein